MAEGEAAKAIGELTVELFPDKPHGYNLVSHYYFDRGNYEMDKIWLNKALAQAPDDSLLWANLADCEQKLGHHTEALAIYRRIVQLDNDPKQVARAKRALSQHK
jgi:tetratricopeptide (TPR) repeat protein